MQFRVRFPESASCPPFILPPTRAQGAHSSRSDSPVLPRRTGRACTPPASPHHRRSCDRSPDAFGPWTIAAGAAILVFILLVLAFKGCLNARTERNCRTTSATRRARRLEGGEPAGSSAILEAPSDQTQDIDRQNQANALGRLRHARRTGRTTWTSRTSSRRRRLPDRNAGAAPRRPVGDGRGAAEGARAGRTRRRSTTRIAAHDAGLRRERRAVRAGSSRRSGTRSSRRTWRRRCPRHDRLPARHAVAAPAFVADQISGIAGRAAAPHRASTATAWAVSLGGSRSAGQLATVQLTKDLSFDVQV